MSTAVDLSKLPLVVAMAYRKAIEEGAKAGSADRWIVSPDGPSALLHSVPRALWPVLRAAGFVAIKRTDCRGSATHVRHQRDLIAANVWQWYEGIHAEPTPAVGMSGTYTIRGDRYSMVVTRIERNGSRVFFRFTDQKREEERVAILRNDGTYGMARNIGRVTFGVAETHMDPHF